MIISTYYKISVYNLFLSIFQTSKTITLKLYRIIKKLIENKHPQSREVSIKTSSEISKDSLHENQSPNSEMWADEFDNLNEINITEQTDIDPCDDIKLSESKDSLDEGSRLESTSIEISEEAKIDSVDLDGLSNRKSKLFNYKLPSVDFLNEEPDVQSDIS